MQPRHLPPVDGATLAGLDWPRIQHAVAQRAQTVTGKERCAALLPLPDTSAVLARLQVVRELMAVAAEDQSWPLLGGVREIKAAVELAHRDGVLEPSQLVDVARTLQTGEAAARWCATRRDRAPGLAAVVDGFGEYEPLTRDIDRCIEPSGRISDDASPELRDLRRRVTALRESLSQRMERLVHEMDAQGLLQDTFHTLRQDRYVLPVKAHERWRVEGIVHDTSQTNQTFFIEPQEVVDLGNRFKLAAAEVQQEELRILRALGERVGARAREIVEDLAALHALDVVAACARLGHDLHCNVPDLSEPDGPAPRGVSLARFRHPVLVLDQLARGEKESVVPNDLHVGRPPVLVITGPNTGGKTVALKGVGLAAVMVRAGLALPAAPGSSVPLYERIHSVVGDGQSLHDHMSSFGAHLHAVKQMIAGVERAREEKQACLCVLDEVMAGTDPEQGAALAQAVLESLAGRGAHVVTTTHFERLKALALDPEAARVFRNASVGLDASSLGPTYRLVYDAPGASSALEMAARLGVPGVIVDRARDLTGEQGRKLDLLVKSLAARQAALDDERAAVAAAHEQARAITAKLEEREEELRTRTRTLEREAREGLLEETRRARRQLSELLESGRSASERARSGDKEAQEQARRELAAITAAETELQARVEQDRRESARAFAQPLAVGSRVHVITLGVDGEIVELGNRGAMVHAGAMHVRVPLENLAPPRGRAGKSTPPAAAARAVVREEPTGNAPGKLDVRGQRVEDALEMLGAFVDRAIGAGLEHLQVVHGHGTGALRDAVRAALKAHPAVRSVSRGGDGQGGNGVTEVVLKDA